MQGQDLAAGDRVGHGDASQVVAERGTAQPGDQGDAEARADQGQVGLELHGDVGDAGEAAGAVVHPVQPLAAD